MKNNHTHYEISIYILTDKLGEWWETLKTDGSTRLFKPGTAQFNKDKTFPTKEAAIKHGRKLDCKRFKVLALTSPESWEQVDWKQEIVFDSKE